MNEACLVACLVPADLKCTATRLLFDGFAVTKKAIECSFPTLSNILVSVRDSPVLLVAVSLVDGVSALAGDVALDGDLLPSVGHRHLLDHSHPRATFSIRTRPTAYIHAFEETIRFSSG